MNEWKKESISHYYLYYLDLEGRSVWYFSKHWTWYLEHYRTRWAWTEWRTQRQWQEFVRSSHHSKFGMLGQSKHRFWNLCRALTELAFIGFLHWKHCLLYFAPWDLKRLSRNHVMEEWELTFGSLRLTSELKSPGRYETCQILAGHESKNKTKLPLVWSTQSLKLQTKTWGFFSFIFFHFYFLIIKYTEYNICFHNHF